MSPCWNWSLHGGSSTQVLVVHSEFLNSVGLWRLPHFHNVGLKNSWESNHAEGCQLLSSLQGWCSFLHQLLVMPAVCLLDNYIKFIFFKAFLVVSFHHHSWTLLSDVVLWKKWPWRLLIILISWHYHLYHLGLGPLSSYVLSYFENWVESETITTFPRIPATLGIVSLLAAITDWFSIVSLQLHLAIKPFQRTLMWFPKLPLESCMNWKYMRLRSEVLLACVVCCNCRCTACWWWTGEIFLFDMSCELWMRRLVIRTIWLLSLRFFI